MLNKIISFILTLFLSAGSLTVCEPLEEQDRVTYWPDEESEEIKDIAKDLGTSLLTAIMNDDHEAFDAHFVNKTLELEGYALGADYTFELLAGETLGEIEVTSVGYSKQISGNPDVASYIEADVEYEFTTDCGDYSMCIAFFTHHDDPEEVHKMQRLKIVEGTERFIIVDEDTQIGIYSDMNGGYGIYYPGWPRETK